MIHQDIFAPSPPHYTSSLNHITEIISSCHPETPDEQLLVSVAESGDFFSWQGNQGITRRRTSVRRTRKAAD